MQVRTRRLSQLRQDLIKLKDLPQTLLTPFLDGHPMTQGTVYVLRRKCSKKSCRCARGQYHESTVLSASIGGRTRLWIIPADRMEEMWRQTERYRRFRKERSEFVRGYARRGKQLLHLIDAIGRIRTLRP